MSLKTMHPLAFQQVMLERGGSLDEWLNKLYDCVEEMQAAVDAIEGVTLECVLPARLEDSDYVEEEV